VERRCPKKAYPLFLHQACVAGDALPLAQIQHPSVCKAANVVIRLALIRALRVVDAGNDGGISEEIHLHFLDVRHTRLETWIFDICQKLLLVADLSIPLRVDEPARHQRVQCSGIPADLRFIPQAFENQELAFARIGLLGRHHD